MKIGKILYKIILVVMFVVMSTSCICYAEYVAKPDVGGFSGLGQYKPTIQGGGVIFNVMNIVLGAIIAIGAILITVFIAITGFGMILGSAEEKAVAKEKFAGYLIAIVILTGGAALAKLLISIAENF